MGKNSWIIFTVIVVALFGGLIIWSRNKNPSVDTSSVDTSTILSASETSGNIADNAKGNLESEAVIVEYGNYQCGACANVNTRVAEFMNSEYGEKVALVYRHFQIPGFTNARAAAGSAEAAGIQGKYWEMHDKIFEGQASWANLDSNGRTNVFVRFAEELDLDVEKFKSDLSSNDINKKISFDSSLGKKDGVTGTPAFFLNGKKLPEDAYSALASGDYTPLQKLIDEIVE